MAVRPIFKPLLGRRGHDGLSNRGPLIETINIDIQWHGGFSLSQKQKNIIALHARAEELGIFPVLEISTKSMQKVGFRLSAFNLNINTSIGMRPLESVYQSSKVFSGSGQHLNLIDLNPFAAKKLIRELGKGEIVSFKFEGVDYATEPKNAFYDWLYLRAILPHEEWIKSNLKYAAYSDIEFTPNKSINCQARAVAEFHSLSTRGEALSCASDFEQFRSLLKMAQREDDI